MNKSNPNRNLFIKKFTGELFINDVISSLNHLKGQKDIENYATVIADIRGCELKIELNELKTLSDIFKDKLSFVSKINLILLTSTPNQVAYSYILKSKLDKSMVNINVYSTIKAALNQTLIDVF